MTTMNKRFIWDLQNRIKKVNKILDNHYARLPFKEGAKAHNRALYGHCVGMCIQHVKEHGSGNLDHQVLLTCEEALNVKGKRLTDEIINARKNIERNQECLDKLKRRVEDYERESL